LDTIEALFAGLNDTAILRAELRRLFRWLKQKGVTAIITGERGHGTLTRQGLEEYVSDCVIVLDHRITEQISTRRLRIVKYRGSLHGADECPFLIDDNGISVLPITSLDPRHPVSTERISSGVTRLDAMLGGGGYYRGTSVLVSGTAGTGKTSVAAQFADAACRRDERVLYMAFEESEGQFIRNMRSIGFDLEPWVQRGLLRFEAARPTFYGLEMHLATMHKQIVEFRPRVVIMDPITNFISVGSAAEARSMLMRMIDLLKSRQITAMFTSLTAGGDFLEQSEVGVSSLMDTWLLLRSVELGGERNRLMHILKSRGMAHSNQLREFLLTDHGIELRDVYSGPEGVLTGSSRLAQEAREKAAQIARGEDIEAKRRELERARQASEAGIAAIRMEYQAKEDELRRAIAREEAREQRLVQSQTEMAHLRKADSDGN
jgi:circadian clock protein KaiC